MLWIDGVKMPSPSELNVSLEERGDDSEYNILGERVVDRLAVKRVIELSWAMLSAEEMAQLFGAAADAVFFTAKFPDPITGGQTEAVCRAVARSARLFRMEGGAARWMDVSMKWEER